METDGEAAKEREVWRGRSGSETRGEERRGTLRG